MFNMESRERLCYYCWIIVNNFGLHSTYAAIDCIFEHVRVLKKERAVAFANRFFPGTVLTSYRITFY